MTAMGGPGSADAELDLGVFPVTPVQLGIFSTPSATCVNVTWWVPCPKSVILLGGVFVARGSLDFSVTAASLATTPSLPVKNAIVMVLAHWGIHVVLEGSVCVVITMLGLDVTSVLQDITAIPTAGVSAASVTLQVPLPLTLDIVNVSSTLKVLPAVNASPCTGTLPEKTPRDVQHASVM